MESSKKPAPIAKTTEDDVDLMQLFDKTGNVLNNFFSWFGRLFLSLGTFLLLILFFLRRNLVWLIAGAAVGMAYGTFLVSRSGNNYYSETTIRTNFNSSRSLYGTLDYFNALINNGQTADLSKIFGISVAEAASIYNFQAAPVTSELIQADMYNERFLNLYHNSKIRIDTFWTKTISYNNFKSSLTKFDYPVHEIRAVSNNPVIFSKLQKGLISQISDNELLKLEKANGDEMNQEEIDMLVSSIRSLDTLRNTYNKRLSSENTSGEKGNNLTLLDGNMALHNPELDLYDKMLELKDELKMIKNHAVLEKNIIQVYAPFSAIGNKAGFLEQKVARYGLIGLLAALLITSVISIYRFIANLEKKHQREKLAGVQI